MPTRVEEPVVHKVDGKVVVYCGVNARIALEIARKSGMPCEVIPPTANCGEALAEILESGATLVIVNGSYDNKYDGHEVISDIVYALLGKGVQVIRFGHTSSDDEEGLVPCLSDDCFSDAMIAVITNLSSRDSLISAVAEKYRTEEAQARRKAEAFEAKASNWKTMREARVAACVKNIGLK